MTMLQAAQVKSVTLARSVCLKCGSEMALSRIEPENPGYEHHVFECTRCGHLQSRLVEIQ